MLILILIFRLSAPNADNGFPRTLGIVVHTDNEQIIVESAPVAGTYNLEGQFEADRVI